MTTAALDSFQLIIGLYLLYIAAKGSGQMYRFGDLSKKDQTRVKKPLRILYLVGGIIALVEFGLCALQNHMFTQTVTQDGTVIITQNYTLEALPSLSYEMLSAISSVLTILVFGLLIGIFVWLRRLSNRSKKE